MPPPGDGPHHYFFRVYALKVHLVVEPGLDKKTLWIDMKDHILGEGVLKGTYER